MSASGPAPRIFRFDHFELDTRAGELTKRGVKLRLQGQPLQVLASLLSRPGDLVTRDELRAQVWPADTFVDFDHSLHNAIARLREALGDSAEKPRYIETLPRRGYRFIARVQPAIPDGGSASPATSGRAAGEIHAIAVLPLEDLSGDSGHEYFADGMTEALITGLAKIKALRVISRTSAMQYKGVRKSLPQIARELNVDAVIEGSILRSGERIRITAQLIHAPTDQHMWAESYERDFRDILALQSEIARQVANQVRVILTPDEQARLGKASAVNPAAHELYLKARYHWNKRTEESVNKALSYFRQAIATDPGSAQAFAGLADCYNILGYYNALPPVEAYPQARAAALKALELDDSLAEPYAAIGVVKRDFEWDWPGALREFQRAIDHNPGLADAYHWRATLLSMLGQHAEALREKASALALDPLSVVLRTDLARLYYFAREYDHAEEHYRAALDLDQHFSLAHLGLAQVHEQQGEREQAIAELQAGVRLSDESVFALARLGHGYATAGRREEAQGVIKRLVASGKQKYVSAFVVAMIHVGLGEVDEAFTCFQSALEERSLWMGYLKVEPQLDPVRADLRFQELLRRVGLA